MTGQAVKVHGLHEVTRSLARAGDDIGKLDEVNAKALSIMTSEAQSRVPRRTGRLAASIRRRSDARTLGIGATAEYAGVIEFGSPARRIAAQPFLGPGVYGTYDQWFPLYLEYTEHVTSKVKGA